MAGKKHPNESKRSRLLHGSVENPTKLRNFEFKKQLQSSPYIAGRSTSDGSKFWDHSQEKLFNEIYASRPVFKHAFVNWSKIVNRKLCGFDVPIKYENLGLKGLTSMDDTWAWNEELVRQFYATLYINPDCTYMEFMIGSGRYAATKEDIEKALSIKPRADSIILHKPGGLNSTDTLSLCVETELDIKKLRKCFKPEVDLIVKINEHTLFPRSGNRGECTRAPCKLAHAIYHKKHFDIAHFLLSEMCGVIKAQDLALSYAPYIIRLLLHLRVIPKDSSLPCFPKKYSSQLQNLLAQADPSVTEHEISMVPDNQTQAVVQHEIEVEQDGPAEAIILNEIEVEQDGQAQAFLTPNGMPDGRDVETHAIVAHLGISKIQDAQAQMDTQHGLSGGKDLIQQVHSSNSQTHQQTDRFDSLVTSIHQLSKKMDNLNETFDKGFKAMDVRMLHLHSEFDEMKALLMENLGPRVVYKRKRLKDRSDDGFFCSR